MVAEENAGLVNVSNQLEQKDEKLLFYNLLKNPVRRQIIKLLSENGAMAATDLKRLLGISVGTLYYHLEFMHPFVVKTEKRKYVLSDKGLRLVESMKVSDFLAESSLAEVGGVRRIFLAFTLNPLLERVQLSNFTLFSVSLLSALLNLLLSWRISNGMLLLHFRSSPTPEIALLTSSLNILLLFILLAAAGYLASFRRGGEASMAATIPIALTPSNILLTYFAVTSALGLSSTVLFEQITVGVYFLLHGWQILSLSAVLVSSKGVSWEKAIAAVVAISYFSLFISQNF